MCHPTVTDDTRRQCGEMVLTSRTQIKLFLAKTARDVNHRR